MAQIKKSRSFKRWVYPKKVLYLGQEKNLIFSSKGIEEVSRLNKEKIRVVALGKEYYFETLRIFPFSNLKDIRSAVETDMGAFSPFETELFFVKKIQGEGGHSKVNIWFVLPDIARMIRDLSPFLIIPETALLSLRPNSGAVLYAINRGPEKEVFAYVGRDGSVRSTFTCFGNPDLKDFRRSMGYEAGDCPVMEISDAEKYRQLLFNTFSAASIRNFSSFWNLDSLFSRFRWSTLKRGLIVTLFLFFIYTGLSMIFPYQTAKKLVNEDKRISASLSGLLKKQGQIEDFERKQKILAEKLNACTGKMFVIKTINDALPARVCIRQLTISGNKVVIKGMAPKASQALAALSKAKGIKNTSFTSPLREDRKSGMEIFTLTFIYEKEI